MMVISYLQPLLSEEFAKQDYERMTNPCSGAMNKVIFDCVDQSPYYSNQGDDIYIDEAESIDLPGDNDYKKYPFGPMNSNTYLANINSKGLKVNKYYMKLNPYYVKSEPSDTTLLFESRFESGNLRRAV